MKINFDMDGTLADLYNVPNWLTLLRSENPDPYKNAVPLQNTRQMSRLLNKLQTKGHEINIISWTAKECSYQYAVAVMWAKSAWLKKYYPNVKWDNIHIIPYNTNKIEFSDGILFDDSAEVRDKWIEGGGTAFDEQNIPQILKSILKSKF